MNGPGLSRRFFLAAVARLSIAAAAWPALLEAATRAARAASGTIHIVASGPSALQFSGWAGRGCSATSSTLSSIGALPSSPYEIDFEHESALVLAGVDPSSVKFGQLQTLQAQRGSAWALAGLPVRADALPDSLDIIVDGVALSLVVDGG